jgi:large subunit ribosomal protein L29
MKNKHKEDLKALDAVQLEQAAEGFRRELFSLRLTSAAAHVEDFSQFKKLRKNVARALTLLQKKNQESRTDSGVSK